MAEKSKIETELLEATGIKRKVAEKTQAYYTRLIDAVEQDVSDADWEGLGQATQNWINAGNKAIKAGKDIPGFEPTGDGATEKKSAKKTAKQDDGDDKPAGKKAAKKDTSAGARDGKKVGAQTMIKQLMIKDPKLTVDQLLEKLNAKGYSPTPLAVSSIRSGFRHSLKVIKDAGHLDEITL